MLAGYEIFECPTLLPNWIHPLINISFNFTNIVTLLKTDRLEDMHPTFERSVQLHLSRNKFTPEMPESEPEFIQNQIMLLFFAIQSDLDETMDSKYPPNMAIKTKNFDDAMNLLKRRILVDESSQAVKNAKEKTTGSGKGKGAKGKAKGKGKGKRDDAVEDELSIEVGGEDLGSIDVGHTFPKEMARPLPKLNTQQKHLLHNKMAMRCLATMNFLRKSLGGCELLTKVTKLPMQVNGEIGGVSVFIWRYRLAYSS